VRLVGYSKKVEKEKKTLLFYGGTVKINRLCLSH